MLRLKMASAQVLETSVTTKSPSQDSNHPDVGCYIKTREYNGSSGYDSLFRVVLCTRRAGESCEEHYLDYGFAFISHVINNCLLNVCCFVTYLVPRNHPVKVYPKNLLTTLASSTTTPNIIDPSRNHPCFVYFENPDSC